MWTNEQLITALMSLVALVLTGFAFWKEDLVLWVLDTIVWLIWAYLVWNLSYAGGNTYINTALALVGAGATLVCIYKDFTHIALLLKSRKRPISYDDEQEQYKQHVIDITRRRY